MEILAPCGSPRHVKAAIYAGADAVYLGGHNFSARRNAANFSAGEIGEAARFCHSFGAKLYVTVNILTRDSEWDAMRAYLTELAAAGPDALIVQDLGVARLCRSLLPELPLHASTQLSVHSPEGVRLCEEAGFTRVVIARECDRKTLSEIVKTSNIGIEAFVHGALCVSVSGQCGLSAVIGGRSGNRGLCAQPCRLDFMDRGRHHALSLKDLSLVREIALLERMGICSLKIEGRMKRPEYVAAAVHACRAALEGREPNLDDLRDVFSRGGFTQGYFYGRHAGMGGVRSPEDAKKTAAVLPRLAELTRAPARRVPVDLDFSMRSGQECRLTLSDRSDTVTLTGPVPEAARTTEITEAEARRLLSRLGSTPFEAANIHISVDPGLSLSAAQMNALRRDACDELLERRLERLTPRYAVQGAQPFPATARKTSGESGPFLRVHCRTLEQAQAVAGEAEQLVLAVEEAEIALNGPDALPADKLLVAPDRYIVDEKRLEGRLRALRECGAQRLLCQNPAHVMLGRRLGYTLHGGLGLNLFNSETATFWAELGLHDLTASMELRLPECLALRSDVPVGLAVYGRLPLMLLRRCPFERTCKKTGDCPGFLSDRTGRQFPVRCYGEVQELLNADLLWMADRLPKLRDAGFLSLLLFDESAEESALVLRAYRQGGAPPPGHTRGLLTRGVE